MRTFKKNQIVRIFDKDFQVVDIDRISKHTIIFVNVKGERHLYIKELLTDENGNEIAEYNRKLNLFFKA